MIAIGTRSVFQSFKLGMVKAVGLPKDALHIYVGLTIFLGAMLVLRKPMRSPVPWLLVLFAAVVGEMWDGFDDLRRSGRVRCWASWHDLWNTLFWPTMLLLLARFRLIGISSRKN